MTNFTAPGYTSSGGDKVDPTDSTDPGFNWEKAGEPACFNTLIPDIMLVVIIVRTVKN